MKQVYLLITFLFLFSFSQAQIVNIPDVNFKNALLSHIPIIDTNDDGEIQVSEAEAVMYLSVFSSNIDSLEGIEYFVNIIALDCRYNNLTSLDLSNQTNLTQLICQNNNISVLNISACTDLITLLCTSNNLNTLDVSANTNLIELDCRYNNLTSLDVTSNTSLNTLKCGYNSLTTLDVSANTNLTILRCFWNQLTALDVSANTSLIDLDCTNNSLTSLDVSANTNLSKLHCTNNPLGGLDVSSNTNLVDLNCGNHNFSALDVSNNFNLTKLVCANSPNLEYINLKNGNNNNFTSTTYGFESVPNLQVVCVDELNSEVTSYITSEVEHEVTFTEYCSFIPAQSNTISGLVRADLDNNGCDVVDISSSHIWIVANNGVESFGTFVLEDATYSIFTNEGDFTTTITTNLPSYWSVTPNVQSNTFTGFDNSFTADFCLTPNQTINDLNISIYPAFSDPRPGFNTSYHLVYNNTGSTTLNGTVNFDFNDAMLNFLSASETISSQTSNSITFDFTNLSPFETRTIDLEFNVFAPPTVEINDILNTTATITPVSGDYTTEDNVFNLAQTVVGSYDPNDIACLEGDAILLEDADKYLHYLIRFQNSGTASAINVVVKNILDDKLDWSTFQLESTSHDSRVAITNGNEVEFIFEDINLPDENTNEPASHGFIAYKIKPKANVVLGDIFNSTADIFFDFNPAITTNTAITEIEQTLSVDEYGNNTIKIYPNPTKDKLTISTTGLIDNITITDINGRVVLSQDGRNTSNLELDMSTISVGMYFVNIQTDSGSETVKVVKQ